MFCGFAFHSARSSHAPVFQEIRQALPYPLTVCPDKGSHVMQLKNQPLSRTTDVPVPLWALCLLENVSRTIPFALHQKKSLPIMSRSST